MAVKGSEVVYLTAGLKYDIKVWRDQWPKIMRYVINACKLHGAKLVFFDNVYSYGIVNGRMTEATLLQPSSRKGEVREKISKMLLDEMRNKHIDAMIVRSADFYGPDSPLSFVQVMVFDRISKGQRPQWMVSADHKHSFTYTPDAGRAMALLGTTPSAFGQVWHAPTDPDTLTGKEFMQLSDKYFGTDLPPQIIPKWLLGILGWFTPVIRESMEMLYQNDRSYIFDSSKFFAQFPDFKYTTYEEGIKQIAMSYGKEVFVGNKIFAAELIQ
jgi:nucleoside-diphosphate-sugar epimerase